jgi:uncharacterized protein YlxW (UPF0749 family)
VDESKPVEESTAADENLQADGSKPDPAAQPSGLTGRQQLVKALWPPRATRSQLIVAVLLFALGVAVAVQVRSSSEESRLRGARQEDLVRILDGLSDRHDRLEGEQRKLERSRADLRDSSNRAAEARRQTEQKAGQLGVLAGTVGATGPGITVRVNDPKGKVKADMLLDTLQELRAAGAEAVELNGVRVVADTYFTEDLTGGRGVLVDGKPVKAPYVFDVIGSAKDLTPALNIPGGVVSTLEKEGAGVAVDSRTKIVIDVLRAKKGPNYARPAPR